MELDRAGRMADKLIKLFDPCCEKLEIAGSIRRMCDDVKDIEIVAQPRKDLQLPHIDMILAGLHVKDRIEYDKNGTRFKSFWLLSKKNKQIIKVDLFIVYPPATWGCIFLIRTGPERFSKWLVNHAKPYYRFHKGQLFHSFESKAKDWQEKHLDTPTEQSVFDFLSLQYIPPQKRK
ncbi:MAG: hypothetical protein V3V41_00315 [Candidatus Heimdallarchaeota archaeon]